MKIFVKAKESGGKDIRLFIPLFLANNKVFFSFIWGKIKVEVVKEFPLDKKEFYSLCKTLFKELKNYKGLQLVNVSKEGKDIVNIVI